MLTGWVVLLAVVGVLVLGGVWGALTGGPRGEPVSGLVWWTCRVYTRVVHRLRVEGAEHVPRREPAGPLIIVANHTAGVDPALVQAACPVFIRWVMAADMRHPAGEFFWRWMRIVFVDRRSGGGEGVRDAVAHLRGGGVLGVFPEGRIERPHGALLPFGAGVGLLVRRSGADVLPVIIRGTPETPTAWGSVARRSRSSVRFMPRVSYRGTSMSAEEIAADLRGRFAEWTGWPLAAAVSEAGPASAPRPG